MPKPTDLIREFLDTRGLPEPSPLLYLVHEKTLGDAIELALIPYAIGENAQSSTQGSQNSRPARGHNNKKKRPRPLFFVPRHIFTIYY